MQHHDDPDNTSKPASEWVAKCIFEVLKRPSSRVEIENKGFLKWCHIICSKEKSWIVGAETVHVCKQISVSLCPQKYNPFQVFNPPDSSIFLVLNKTVTLTLSWVLGPCLTPRFNTLEKHGKDLLHWKTEIFLAQLGSVDMAPSPVEAWFYFKLSKLIYVTSFVLLVFAVCGDFIQTAKRV